MEDFLQQAKRQFFGKPFWVTLLVLILTFFLSAFVFQTPLADVAIVAIGLSVFAMSLWKLEWGIAAVFAELFANSHGHLLSATVSGFTVSLRMGIFFGVMSAWLILLAGRRVQFSFRDTRLLPFWILLSAIGFGFLLGAANNPLGAVFNDGNGYLYLGYLLPVMSLQWSAVRQRLLIQVLFASAIWVSLLSLGLLYIFTHVPAFALSDVYQFVRDTRTAEITDMGNGFYRIFLQAQFSVIVALFLSVSFAWLAKSMKQAWSLFLPIIGMFIAVLVIGLSRSFWVGTMAGAVIIGLFLVYKSGWGRRLWQNIALTGLAKIFSIVLLLAIIAFPFPTRVSSVGSLSDVLGSRTSQVSDAAVDSRWQLVGPMWQKIKEQPITGHGFGTEVAFTSDDPRVRAISPDGTWETYAFEWGWLDVWIKMGLVGVVGFLWAGYVIFFDLKKALSKQRAWIGIGLIGALVMLYVTHIFSPYLNHPLGLGLLVFVIPFLSHASSGRVESPVFSRPVKSSSKMVTSPAVQTTVESDIS